jgi:threonine synthase
VKFKYTCSECGTSYEISPQIMVCPDCAAGQQPDRPVRGVLEVSLEGGAGKDFRVFDLLPVEERWFPPIPVGNTPLWAPERLRKRLGFAHLCLKDDTLNPTGSFKDRASYLVAAFARRHGLEEVVVASTGNAASSMAGVGAAAGLKVSIFIPKTAPQAKMVQSLQYGARVTLVEGSYDQAYELSLECSRSNGSLNRNTAYNPLTIEGKKTVSLELCRQLPQGMDALFIPVGDGVIVSGVYKGFQDLLQLGLIERMPQIYAVQAEGSNAICRALETGDFAAPLPSKTVADSIAVDIPRGGLLALKYLKRYRGRCVIVSDDEILSAQKELASSSGLFAEPAAAAAFAGFLREKENLSKDCRAVVLLTGSGLKDIQAAMLGITLPE